MIILKSTEEIERMRRASQIVREVLDHLKEEAQEGVSTWDLDRLAEQRVIKLGAKPAFKGYQDFPGSVCFAVNEEIVHGIPSKKKVLGKGDIVGMDFGAYLDGFYGDSAVTVAIGEISTTARKLLKATEESLFMGIDMCRPGKLLLDIGRVVQAHVERAGFSIVTTFVGHGIGRSLHEDPQVPNYVPGNKGLAMGMRLKPGLVLAIEPMVNAGDSDVTVLEDGWTAVTKDGSLSAHFEHTVAITNEGPVVLSQD